MYEYYLCVYVCVHIHGNVCTFMWECVHVYVGVGVCACHVSEVNCRCGPSSSTLLEMESVVLCSSHTRVAGLQASGGSGSPSAVGALGLQMRDIYAPASSFTGVLCAASALTPTPLHPSQPSGLILLCEKESQGAQCRHAQHTTSDLSPGNCVTSRAQGGSWASFVVHQPAPPLQESWAEGEQGWDQSSTTTQLRQGGSAMQKQSPFRIPGRQCVPWIKFR